MYLLKELGKLKDMVVIRNNSGSCFWSVYEIIWRRILPDKYRLVCEIVAAENYYSINWVSVVNPNIYNAILKAEKDSLGRPSQSKYSNLEYYMENLSITETEALEIIRNRLPNHRIKDDGFTLGGAL